MNNQPVGKAMSTEKQPWAEAAERLATGSIWSAEAIEQVIREACEKHCEDLRAILDTALRDYKVYAEENERLHRICVNREESLERTQRQAAAMREALEKVWAEDECGYITGGDADECVKCGAVASTKALMLKAHSEDCTQAILERALATDAGQDFVPIEDVKPLLDALEKCRQCTCRLDPCFGEIMPSHDKDCLSVISLEAIAAWTSKHGGKGGK